MDIRLIIEVAVGLAALAAIITLSILLIVSRRQLRSVRAELEIEREQQDRRRRRLGVGPLAVRTMWQTADSLLNKGIGATVRNSVEDIAGWAQVERPDLARLTADGDVVIVFSDIESSTELNEKLGDREWVKLLERHRKLTEKLVAKYGGYVVKNQGDGFMIAFRTADDAVRCALELQQQLTERSLRHGSIRVRIGMHQGSSVRRGDDLFGRNVAMAARVAGEAGGGEILISEPVAAELGEEFEIGEGRRVELKGIKGEQTLYPVVVPGDVS